MSLTEAAEVVEADASKDIQANAVTRWFGLDSCNCIRCKTCVVEAASVLVVFASPWVVARRSRSAEGSQAGWACPRH